MMTATILLAMQVAAPVEQPDLEVAIAAEQGVEFDVDCRDTTTQMDMNICAFRDYEAADRELNEQWRETAEVMKAADAGSHYDDGRSGSFEALLEGQRAWLKLRDAHCRLVGYDVRGGSLEPMMVSMCRTRMTRERTFHLRELTINQASRESKIEDY